MKRFRIWQVLLLALVLCSPPGYGEVGVDITDLGGGSTGSSFIVMGRGGGDGGTPWPWTVYRETGSLNPLNPRGDEYDDGPAAFAMHPDTGQPYVVWAYNDGYDYEIVLSHWDGSAWTKIDFLTRNLGIDDLDPAITIAEDGKVHVTWWRANGRGEIWLTESDAGHSGWSDAQRISSDLFSGSKPSTTTADQRLFISYQSEPFGLGLYGVMAMRRTEALEEASWERWLITTTSYQGPAGDGDLDIQIHERNDAVWIDWVSGDGVISYTVWDPVTGSWCRPISLNYTWDESEGEYLARERSRVSVRLAVFAQ